MRLARAERPSRGKLMSSCSEDALPSDFEATLQLLFSQAPRGARLCGGTLAVVPVTQVYAVLLDHTEADRELEAQRSTGAVRIIALPGTLREERLLVRGADCEAALRSAAASCTDAADAAALAEAIELLIRCPGHSVLEADIRGDAHSIAAALVRIGWLVPRLMLTRGGPWEAPEAEGRQWLWSLPRCGMLVRGVLEARASVLRTLGRQKFGRALRHVVDGPSRAALRKCGLELGFVIRDLVGREWCEIGPRSRRERVEIARQPSRHAARARLPRRDTAPTTSAERACRAWRRLDTQDTAAGTVLQLTHAGKEAASAAAARSSRGKNKKRARCYG